MSHMPSTQPVTETWEELFDELEDALAAEAAARAAADAAEAVTRAAADTALDVRLDDLEAGGSNYWFNVADYGAAGDAVTDDTAAIQAAIDAAAAVGGGIVICPPGTYLVSEYSTTHGCLFLKSGVHLRGTNRNAVTIKLADSQRTSVCMIATTVARGATRIAAKSDQTISDLTLDGNKANQSVEVQIQRDGVFAQDVERLRIERVTSQNFAGDGVYIGTEANHTQMTDTLCQLNARNGCSLANGGQHNFDGYGCTFISNAAQQFDCESTGGSAITTNVTLTNCKFDGGGVSTDYVLTVWGSSQTNKGKNWVVTGCEINGPIFIVWCDDVLIEGCWGTNPTATAWADIWRNCNRVTIEDCRITMSQTSTNDVAGIYVTAVSNIVPTTNQPRDIFIRGNTITMAHDEAFAIYINGGENVHVLENTCIGPGVSTAIYAGIRVRATQDVRYCKVRGNTCRNIGKDGIQVSGNQPFNYGFTAVAGTDVVTATETATLQYFTAATTDILTATNVLGSPTTTHMETGDGPIRLSSTGTLPAGLAAATDYYWIKVTTSTGKLATSYANAIAGTPVVDVTDTGTGGAGAHSWINIAQPWQTGHGPLRVTSTTTLPAGLALSTDYWWIKVTSSTGKLATSYANAIAGTAVDITDTGTGTHTLAMSFGFDHIDIHDNHSEDTAVTPTMSNGLYLEDNTGPARYLSLRDNTTSGIANPIANYPVNGVVQTGGNRGGTCEFTCVGAPAFAAAIGSRANRRDGGPGTTTYVNETGLYSGWVAV
jgi:polygalacturonase